MSVNMNFACFGTWRMLDFVFTCYQSLIFSKLYECIKSTEKDSQTQELRRVRAVFVNFIA